ncbi:MAG: tetratricopeptide repeat protein [Sphingobacteriaceae bacterium]|nr:tetratricopeptide repeat protein [Sphingobacteriaceae bacterium]
MKSLNIHREMGNRHDMISSLNNIGALFRKKKDFAKALEYHRQSQEILNTFNELKGKIENHSNFGLVYLDMGKCKDAILEFDSALKFSKELGDKKWRPNN